MGSCHLGCADKVLVPINQAQGFIKKDLPEPPRLPAKTLTGVDSQRPFAKAARMSRQSAAASMSSAAKAAPSQPPPPCSSSLRQSHRMIVVVLVAASAVITVIIVSA